MQANQREGIASRIQRLGLFVALEGIWLKHAPQHQNEVGISHPTVDTVFQRLEDGGQNRLQDS
ncbi:hypothetical protein NC653_025426 [Populus alba x Populus x berolinensis]|uniref:Uncharacterized protein n=1 Tax=Populus alba x Populus x berolinensis TaxID=444605 RepID=A0AAD6MBJ4_9ROSI|nr:hypothetical protein NC653_025426 [Populus alba x Populus x berolinensis]